MFLQCNIKELHQSLSLSVRPSVASLTTVSIRGYKLCIMDMIYNWTGFEKGPMPPEGAACGFPFQKHHPSAVNLRRFMLALDYSSCIGSC
jgi:hypothetical protein